MKSPIATALAIFLLTAWTFARAQDSLVEARPFGVTWGASFDETAKTLPGAITFGGARSLLKFDASSAITDINYAAATFEGERLTRILLTGGTVDNDPYGVVVRRRFHELRTGLQAKYGVGKSKELIAEGYEGQYFGLGILTGVSNVSSFWEVGDVTIVLAVSAESSGSMHWILGYSHTPSVAAKEKQNREKEADAL